MSEPLEFDFVPLKRAALYLVGKHEAALRYRRQRDVDKIKVFVDSDFAGGSSLEEEHDGIGGSDRLPHCEISIDASELESIERWRSGVTRSVKGGRAGLTLRSMYQDLGIPMKIEIQSDSSTPNSLTDRLGAGQRTKHIGT